MTATNPGIPPEVMVKLKVLPTHQLARIMEPPAKHTSARELFRDACAMKRAGITACDQEIVLRARFNNYYRPLDDREIANAIANANDTPSSGPRWPKANPDHLLEITRGCVGALDRLRVMSPVRNPGALTAGAVIDRLFKAEDLLCFGTSDHRAFTEPRGHFLGDEASYPLVVPNAMKAASGTTLSGRESPRTLSNVGPRDHAVVEFDSGSLDEQASILLHLASVGPTMRLVVFSGSKSLHGWFDVRSCPTDDVDKFLRYAAYAGADTATFNPVQFVRTPNAWRDDERRQVAEFLS
jgi:hypothetical protein